VTSVAAGGLLKLAAMTDRGAMFDLIDDAATAMGLNLNDDQILQTLAAILAADFALALSALTGRNRLGLAMLAIWIVASAAIWIVARYSAGYASFLLDASAAGAPMAVLLFWICALKEQPPVIVPG